MICTINFVQSPNLSRAAGCQTARSAECRVPRGTPEPGKFNLLILNNISPIQCYSGLLKIKARSVLGNSIYSIIIFPVLGQAGARPKAIDAKQIQARDALGLDTEANNGGDFRDRLQLKPNTSGENAEMGGIATSNTGETAGGFTPCTNGFSERWRPYEKLIIVVASTISFLYLGIIYFFWFQRSCVTAIHL